MVLAHPATRPPPPAKTSVSRIPGVRYVYNVCDTPFPGYSTCKSLVGFDNQNCHGGDTVQQVGHQEPAVRWGRGVDHRGPGLRPLTNGSGPPASTTTSAPPAGSTRFDFPGLATPQHTGTARTTHG